MFPGGFNLIEILRKDDSYYQADMTDFETEMKAFGFEVVPFNPLTRYNNTIYDRNYNGINVRISKGGFSEILVLGYGGYSSRKCKFIIPEENGSIKVDGAFVQAYYEKWKKADDQRKIRENVSQFKGPLVYSFVRGTLESADIEYTEKTIYTGYSEFTTKDFVLDYTEPPPGELAKLNLENVKVTLRFDGYYVRDVHFKKFVTNPQEYMDALKIICREKQSSDDKLNNVKTKYEKQIEEIQKELTTTYNKFSKMNNDKYTNSIKDLFRGKK
jgi:hypothetical protein